jgi:hypothetical protein
MTDVCINVGIVLGSMVGFVCEELISDHDLKWYAAHPPAQQRTPAPSSPHTKRGAAS